MGKTRSEIVASGENIGGEIFIGCGETEAVSILVHSAKNLKKKYPLVHCHLYSGNSERTMEKLDRGLIDFGLMVGLTHITKYDFLRLPVKDTWGVLMSDSSPLAEKPAICPEDLWDKPLILSHQITNDSDMLEWIGSDISGLNVVATYDLLYNAAQFAKNGFGYVIAMDKIINTSGDTGLCFRPLSPWLETELLLYGSISCFQRHLTPFLASSDRILKIFRDLLNNSSICAKISIVAFTHRKTQALLKSGGNKNAKKKAGICYKYYSAYSGHVQRNCGSGCYNSGPFLRRCLRNGF